MNQWPVNFTFDVSLLTLVVLALALWCLFRLKKISDMLHKLEKQQDSLSNEFRAMTSGQLGMGREIQRVMQEMASVESKQQDLEQESMGTDAKTYEQAGLLLARGASIEEVVESCEIAPAEAELLAIMRNSAPSHTPSGKFPDHKK